MKTTYLIALSAILGTCAFAEETTPAPAADAPKPPAERARPQGGRGSGGSRMSTEDRVKRMTETLGLTEEQQAKIKAIYDKSAAEMKVLRDKGFQNLTDEDRTKMREMMKTQTEAVNAVLTQEQKDKMKADMEKRRGAGRTGTRPGGGRRGAPPATDKPADKDPE
ncbi:MAG: Spy/CpxP family protein refolding chaperone [Akkermansiaceae bacterium]|nr:Spy/CpxP family protein refolding chaperone [Akkermansiaceae bacterium]